VRRWVDEWRMDETVEDVRMCENVNGLAGGPLCCLVGPQEDGKRNGFYDLDIFGLFVVNACVGYRDRHRSHRRAKRPRYV
jgi:hypothetical protein